jgi:hypothetical protein
MFPTVEVRWFFKGVVPAEVGEWFRSHGVEAEEQPARVDHYLRIVEGDFLGIKLREGRFEVKQRYGQQTIVRFGSQTEGCVEQWRKWSFELAQTSDIDAVLNGDSSKWISIKKKRKIHTFCGIDLQPVRNLSSCGSPERGCTWEIANVKVVGSEDAWWSMGLEAFGKENELWNTLVTVADRILSLASAPAFKIEHSYGYPSWLQQVGQART